MAKNYDISFDGTESLDQIFDQLPRKTNKQIMLKVFRKASKPVVNAIKQETPVRFKGSHGRPPGNLLRSIGLIAGKSSKFPTLYIGPRAGKKFSNDGWYAKFLVLGTRFIKKTNPFVQKGWSRSEQQAEKIIETEMGNTITKTLQKYAVK